MTREFDIVRATAQDISSLLAIAQAGILLELPGVQRELKNLQKRLRARLDLQDQAVPEGLQMVYQESAGHITGLLERESSPDHQQPTAGTLKGRQTDWLAAERRAERLSGEEAGAADHLVELWYEIRKSMQAAQMPLDRVFRQKTRKAALQPLERLPEERSRLAMELWLPWARRWQSKPAFRGNGKRPANCLQVIEPLVMQGRSPARVDAALELPAGRARALLGEALQDYARNLQIFLDNNDRHR